ncbi:Hypothetical protein AT6N2_L1154 [Agrobacterium tumefaciens]|uniref:hypothetical protein n=1 Tax=Agrobacterium tumefaciens TaxID=358 RepID=UPI001AD98473|nr:hypothetical protein [Agrobacterium tumefaciens]QTK81966.1 Hypothetical protein AT6N2_L1154 [Agrobacterium tumefaciens]
MAIYLDDRAMIAASKTYSKVITEVKAAWFEAFGSEMTVHGDLPRARFENMLAQLRERWSRDRDKARLFEALDLDAKLGAGSVEDLVEAVADDSVVRSVDDLTPNQILSAIEATAYEISTGGGPVEIDMASFLRAVIRCVFANNDIRGRINIGSNRHFPRLYQWLCEYARRTEWSGGSGFKIRNLSGKGRIAKHPADPKELKVIVDRAFL